MMAKPRVSYIDPSSATVPAMRAALERCTRGDRPQPASQTVRARFQLTADGRRKTTPYQPGRP